MSLSGSLSGRRKAAAAASISNMSDSFQLESDFQPRGDQPSAIAALTEGVRRAKRYQTLLGVTGSGKTYTVANVVANVNLPTLVISHNKTLVAQLYSQ